MEIDETLIVRRKYERGRILSQIWLFGGIELASKRRFIVPLTGDVGEKRDRATLIPLIQKYIKSGSVIYSDSWGAYRGLRELGYEHSSVNHSENFVDPGDKAVHTQNIERLWRDVKEWVKRPGIRAKYLHQYLARYLFISSNQENAVHAFFVQAAKMYPPQGDRQRGTVFVEDSSDEEDDDT